MNNLPTEGCVPEPTAPAGLGSPGFTDGVENRCRLHMRLLGPFALLKDGCPLAAGGDRVEALLCVLAVAGASSRSALVDALWPDETAEAPESALSSLICRLHKQLRDTAGASPIIIHSHGSYRLDERVVLADVTEFQRLAEAGDQSLRAGNTADAYDSYSASVALYDGDLCGGSHPWVIHRRHLLSLRCANLLLRLAEMDTAQRGFRSAVAHLLRLLLADPTREDAVRLAMQCYLEMGAPAAAVRLYNALERALRDELGAQPNERTAAAMAEARAALSLTPGRRAA